jgi:Skp family chaperone for outer membrane proteins
MKYMLRILVAGLILGSVASCPAAGAGTATEGRIATVDLRKIFDAYWKKKQAEAVLKERSDGYAKEITDRQNDLRKEGEEYQTLMTNLNDPNVSPDEREKRKKETTEKLKHLRELEDELKQFDRTAQTTISEQSQRLRNNIITEIRNVVGAKAKAGNFSMVVDTAAESLSGAPVVLYTNNENDITDAVLLQLNATAPTELPKTDDKTPDKKDEKGPEKKDEKKKK